MPVAGYRKHPRSIVAASAAPYGYTLTVWTAGAVTSHAEGIPSSLDALLLLAGAVLAFGAVGAIAYGGVNSSLTSEPRSEIRIWGGIHLPSVGASILLVTLVNSLVHGHTVWPVVGFSATATYLLVIGIQFHIATSRTRRTQNIRHAEP